MSEVDIFDDVNAPEGEDLAKLASVARQLQSAVAREEQLAAELAIARQERIHLQERVMPDLMATAGVTSFETSDHVFSEKSALYGSFPTKPEDRATAVSHISEHGGDHLLVSEISMTFEKSKHNAALARFHDLENEGLSPSMRETVNVGSLKAWVKEAREAGKAVDPAVLGLYDRRFVTIKAKGAK